LLVENAPESEPVIHVSAMATLDRTLPASAFSYDHCERRNFYLTL
jgi:hypothetical protein